MTSLVAGKKRGRVLLAGACLLTLNMLLLVRDTRGAGKDTLELLFIYGSEKEEWVKDVTKTFNAAGHKTSGGKVIRVKAVPLGSGETIDEVMSGRPEGRAHLVSPASAAFIKLGNADSQARKMGDLVGPTKNLVLSPVVIAMWRPMAEAIGWGKKPVGWSDILKLSRDPQGWAAVGKAHWKSFKFGHTHPDYSNSGLISLFAEVYAATGKTEGLTVADIEKPEVGDYLEAIERSVVSYGSSTGFFGKALYQSGMSYLSAAVLYENMVIEAKDKSKQPTPLVAIYPKEGTFWSDHPVGIVNRPWVSDEHRKAARLYIDYLLARPQQEKALKYGFRPGDESIPLKRPIDADHGVNPKEPRRLLEVPEVEVMRAIRKLWGERRKKARVVLVLDVSGSMKKDRKLTNAQRGAVELVSLLRERDTLSLLAFSSKVRWLKKGIALNPAGQRQARQLIRGLKPAGRTALYDATEAAYRYLQDRPRRDVISAIIVLTDGLDNRSKQSLAELLRKIEVDFEKRTTRIFTIAYGNDANPKVLKRIADATQAKFYQATPQTIRTVFKDIATFFSEAAPASSKGEK
jgi:Ca-activated chloride channel family protein